MKKKTQLRRRICFLHLLLVLAILLNMGTAGADGSPDGVATVDPVGQPENFSAVLYDNTNGLPTSEANAIVQTSEGFIWIGSYGGLIRYDGNTFVRMDSTSGITSIKCLFVDNRDRLWIGTNDNGVAVMERGELRKWGKLDGMKSAHTRAITGDQNGTVYVATTCGIVTIDPEGNLRMMEEEAIAEANMRDLRMGSDGIIYGVTNFGDLMKIRDGKLISFLRADESPVQGVATMLPDPTKPGSLWFEGGDFGFYHASYGETLTDLEKIDIQPLSSVQQMEYIDGKVWICSSNGIGVLGEDGLHVLEGLPMNNSIGHVMRDYLGNLWFTSTRQGVMKVVPNPFSDLFERYGLQKRVVNSTCMCEGKLFVATDNGLIVIGENGPVSSLPLTKAVTNTGEDAEADDLIALLDGCRIRSVIRDSRDRLWISTWRKFGLLRYEKGELTVIPQGDGPLANSLRAVSERRDGTILVALTGGVNVIDGDRIIASYGEADGIVNTESLTVEEGTNGDIVLGSNGGGIYIINETGVRNINVEDGLPSDIVMRLKRDPKRDLIWIVTSNAIAYMTPDYQVTTVQKFPYSNNFDLFENSKGDMWVLSSNGIYVTPAEELIANGEINPVYYSIANGLPCITTANSYSDLTPDGDLYIAGTTGICKVNIEQPFENVDELKATVPFVEVDGRMLYPNADGAFVIPSDTQKLTVYSYVFNYSLSDPQVSFRLDGFERSGTTVNRSDMVPVGYTNLRGGTYHYTMQLKDSLGRGDREVSVLIIKEKAFYEQVWFYILAGLAAAVLIALLVRLYVRRKMSALEAKHREEARRERIENELQLATNIQASMLPHTFPAFPGRGEFDIYASMKPAKEVGGDFYDFFLIDDDHLGLVMADVSGKGVPAALFMMVSRALIRAHLQNGESPAKALENANEQLCESNEAELFVTVWAAVLEISTGKGVAANAGHEHPALRRADGAYELQVYRHSPAVATMGGMRFREHSFELNPGDSLFVYTDGVAEATSAQNELFGSERMIDALNVNPGAEPEEVLSNVMHGIDAFVADAEQFDDITMLCLKYNGPADRKA
ncbi:MAG: histidine kinase [Clostridiales bacterium]|nr:histidine kinase [Clostridiales bacterium]